MVMLWQSVGWIMRSRQDGSRSSQSPEWVCLWDGGGSGWEDIRPARDRVSLPSQVAECGLWAGESPGQISGQQLACGPLRACVRGLLPVPLSFSIREAGFGPAPSSNPESQPGAKHTRKVRVRALG